MKSYWPRAWVGTPVRAVLIALAGYSTADYTLRVASGTFETVVAALLAVVVPTALLLYPKLREAAIATVAVVFSLALGTDYVIQQFVVAAPLLYVAFLIGAHSPRRHRAWWLAWMLAGTLAAAALSIFRHDLFGEVQDNQETVLALLGIAFLGAWPAIGFCFLLGAGDRKRREEQRLLRERAEMAGAVERNRIAREMHDIIAHNLTGVIALADGARFASQENPQAAAQALETIAATSRDSLQQMRGLLSVLRTDESRDSTAAPGVADVAGLCAAARRSGFDLRVTGMDELPSGHGEYYQFTIYRLVQETLTNMLKHASAPHGYIEFSQDGSRWLMRASNPADAPAGEDPGGFGVIGMGERLRALGGQLRTRYADGTYELEIEVPL